MTKRGWYHWLAALTGLWLIFTPLVVQAAARQTDGADYACGGGVEQSVWRLWDDWAKVRVQQQVQTRLNVQGDVYALYDVQVFLHNTVAMAQRCHRSDRLSEIADILGGAYLSLEIIPPGAGLGWICKGGLVCSNNKALLNHEVTLDSIQFLALAADVANALPTTGYAQRTAEVLVSHLNRWSDPSQIKYLGGLLDATGKAGSPGASAWIYTDRYLWQLALYADLAGMIAGNPQRQNMLASPEQWAQMRAHFSILWRLFKSRVAVSDVVGANGLRQQLAEVDKGFWGGFPDNRYAAYDNARKPAVCELQTGGAAKKRVDVAPSSVGLVNTLGWDFSHARRLVHVLEAVARNKVALKNLFAVNDVNVVATVLAPAFAQQIRLRVWNGNVDRPLFANYLNGTNGWYRVAYDNGTPGCVEGYPPSGLSDSFATGGYITWAKYAPELGAAGRSLYRLSRSEDPSEKSFMGQYYPALKVDSNGGMSWASLMFWPTLVEVGAAANTR